MGESTIDVVKKMGQFMTNGLNNIYETALVYSDAITSTAQLICGIAAFVYIGSLLWRSWAKGQEIDFYSMLRPFAVGLLIVFFSGFVSCLDAMVLPVDYATEYVRNSAKETETASKADYETAAATLKKIKTNYELNKPAETKEKLGVWKSINKTLSELKDSVLGAFESLSSFIFKLLAELALTIINIFTVAVVYFYKIYVITAKIILVLIGPFSLAMSIFPGFHSNLKGWIAQYLNISMYLPICNIIGFVQSMIVSECLYNSGASTYNSINTGAATAETISLIDSALSMTNISAIILGVVAIMLYAHVPTFANWIIRGDGSGGLASFFSVGGAAAVTSASNNGVIPVPSLGTSNNNSKLKK